MCNRQFLVFAVLSLLPLAAVADSTIKTRNSTMGHSTESTVYIKARACGPRARPWAWDRVS